MSDIAVQASFNSGEWAPALFARVDIIKYRSGAALLQNWFVDYRGGASTRPGTRFVGPARDGEVRLIPFQETSEVGYVLVFTDHAIQFVYRGQMITENSFAISAATQADPCVITVVGNNFVIGDTIFVTGVVGMTELNDRYFIVSNVAGNAVTLTNIFTDNVDATAFTAYSSAGTAARLYTLVSPYAGTDLAGLKYAQNINQMVICSPNFDPYILTIITANNWTIAPIVIGSTADPPDTCTVTTSLAAGTVNYAYVVTSVDALGQESLPSPIGTLANVQDLRSVAGSNEIQWDIADGAAYYRVYKADVSYIGAVPSTVVFGYIGYTPGLVFIDSNIGPDFSITPPVSTNPFVPTGSITAINVTAPGTFTQFPKVFIQGSATAPAHAHAILAVQGTPTVGAAGTGYAVNDTLSFANGVVLVVASIGGGGSIATFKAITVAPSNKGSLGPPGPIPANPVTPTGTSGGGTGATANLVWGADSVVIDDPGAGYIAVPTVIIGSTLSAATATAVLTTSGNAHPTVPGFFQERLVLASSPDRPQTFWMSHPGQYFNFNVSNPIRPDDSIEATLVAGTLNTIQSIVSSTSGMLMLTDNGSWIVNGGSSGSAVTTSSIVANAQSYNGANNVRPIVANYDVLYVQQKGSSVRDLAFNIYFNVFTGTDISILPSHLFFGYEITEWAWAEEPFKIVWAIRSDGVMLSLTFMKEQDFIGWAHHITDGFYKTIAAVTEPDEATGDVFVDAPYVAIQRTVVTTPPPPPGPPPPPPPSCSGFTLSNAFNVVISGNVVTPAATGIGFATVPLVNFKNTGKWYFEVVADHPGTLGSNVGLIAYAGTASQVQAPFPTNSAVVDMGGIIFAERVQTVYSLGTITAGSIIGIAVDFSNWQVWFRIAPSGNWNGVSFADPATNVGGVNIGGYANTLMGVVVSFAAGGFANNGQFSFNCAGVVGTVPSGFTAGWPDSTDTPTDGGLTFFDTSTAANTVFDDGYLITQHSSTSQGGARALTSSFKGTGKYYYEIRLLQNGVTGDMAGAVTLAGTYINMLTLLTPPNCFEVNQFPGEIYSNGNDTGISIGGSAAKATIGVALDFVNHKAWVRYCPSGNWNGSPTADPATNTGGISISSFSATTMAPAVAFRSSLNTVRAINPGRYPFLGTPPAGFTSAWPKT